MVEGTCTVYTLLVAILELAVDIVEVTCTDVLFRSFCRMFPSIKVDEYLCSHSVIYILEFHRQVTSVCVNVLITRVYTY